MRTLLRGGHVHSPHVPAATALVVDGGAVAWVGTDDDAPAGCDIIADLEGALVLPGFVDAHVHATQTGLALAGLDLSGAPSLGAALDAVATYARAHPGVVLGTGWDDTTWPEHRPPTAAELDQVTGGGAVYLARVDAHSAVASSALLAQAGISAETENVEGLVRLDAHHAVRRAALSSVSAEQRRAAQRCTRERAAALGIASLHEMGGPEIGGEGDFVDLLTLAAQEPGPEFLGYWGELQAVDKARDLGAIGAGGDLFVDGSLGSHTAWLSDPYADEATCGHAWLSPEEIGAHVLACVNADMQAGFHAIGDAAIDAVLDGVAAAAEIAGAHRVAKMRHRIEHAELVPEPAALARLGIVASVQPAFDHAWGGPAAMYVERLGTERAARMNPFAELAASGVTLAFGSDSPVTPLDPWGTLRAAVVHRTPGQALNYRAAFAAHTTGGYAAARRHGVGTLVPGAPASYAVWSVSAFDAFTGLPDLDAPDPICLRTAVRGAVIFDRAGALT